jgi:hypothetical protein
MQQPRAVTKSDSLIRHACLPNYNKHVSPNENIICGCCMDLKKKPHLTLFVGPAQEKK